MLIAQTKTNWKFLLIVIVLAVIAGAGILAYLRTIEIIEEPVVEEPEILPEEEIEIADWQTYKNEEYGFEIKYPENWAFLYTIDEVINWKSDKEIRDCCNNCSFGIHVYNKENNLSFSEWAHKQFDVPWEENIVSEMKINDLDVIKHENNDNLGTRILFRKDKAIVSIKTSFELCQSVDVFNQMLSTFRFLE